MVAEQPDDGRLKVIREARLRDHIIEADGKQFEFLVVQGVCRECDDWDALQVGIGPQSTKRFDAGHLWHAHVQENQGWRFSAREVEALLSATGGRDAVSAKRQVRAVHIARVFEVVNDQHKRT
jgi:hypothetical protein